MGRRNRNGKHYRVTDCMRHIAPKWEKDPVTGKRYAESRDTVEVWRSERRCAATYRNLVVCGSVWMCPVCATRISELRAKELSVITQSALHITVLVTLTLRHTFRDKLSKLLSGVLDSFDAIKAGRSWQALKSEMGIVGTVKSLEVTHGKNGWHPHIHLLVVMGRYGRGDVDLPSIAYTLETWFKTRWEAALERREFNASWERGVMVETTYGKVQDYVAKYGRQPDLVWSVERELAKAVSKQSSHEGKTPWELLDDAFLAPTESERDFAMSLWLEYVQAFEGKHQLDMSNELRAIFGIGDKTDQELAESVDDDYKLFAELTWQQWAIILRHELRGELLEAAARMTREQFKTWLASVQDMPNATLHLNDVMDTPPPRMSAHLAALLESL